ncbi:MAG: glycoside hydrolase family 2, partial [Bacilli bacterium]
YEQAFIDLYEEQVIPSLKKGLAAAIYTQLSDVETETNGILTYDRKVCKLNPERVRKVNEKLRF